MEAQKDYIFISYSRDDEPKVTPIVEEMRKSGYQVWYDANIQPGKYWLDNIASRIANCTVFVAFLSQTSLNSPYCQMEIHHAVALQKTVIPVYLEDVTLEAGLDMQLARFQAVKYANPAELMKTLRKSPDFERCGGNVPDAQKKRNYAKLIVSAFEKSGKQLHSGWNAFLLDVLFPLEAFLLIVAVLIVVSIYNDTRIRWNWDENGVLDIKSPIFSMVEMTDYSYSLGSDFLPPPWAKQTPLIQFVVIRNGITHIGASAFQDCSNMKYAVISEGVTTIGENAFSGCTHLQSVDFPSSVTTIGRDAFADCSALKQMQISDGVQIIGQRAFANCVSLEEITIPNSVHLIGIDAFSGCYNLRRVHIQSSVKRARIVGNGYWDSFPISEAVSLMSNPDTLYISATAFDPDTEIIYNDSMSLIDMIFGPSPTD